MRKIILSLLIILLGLRASTQNVVVSGAVVGNGSYPTLTAAFNALNAGSQPSAVITISIVANTNEGSSTAILLANSWTSVTVLPVGGQRSITGATAAGNPIVFLEGADNVTFNGQLPGGVRGLTIENTLVSGQAGTCTVLLRNDALFNTFTYCNIYGASQTTVNNPGGNILLYPGPGSAGCDNNTFSYCNIGPSGNFQPTKAIHGYGGSMVHNNNTIQYCNIYDYFHPSIESNGIVLYHSCQNWNIRFNRFYQTVPRLMSGASYHRDILMNSSLGNYGHIIEGNTFGYANSAGTGVSSYRSSTNNAAYIPIDIPAADDYGPTSILNNVIAGISFPALSSADKPINFTGIHVNDGIIGVSGNTIGSLTVPGSISMTNLGGIAIFRGIDLYTGAGGVYAANNTIAGWQLDAPNGGSINFIGIKGYNVQTVNTNTVNLNQIGTAAAPIVVNGNGTNDRVIGIDLSAPDIQLSNNTVCHIRSKTASTGISIAAGVIGIMAQTNGSSDYITNNKVFALESTHPSAGVTVIGIIGVGPEAVRANLIHSLAAASPSAKITGLHIGLGYPSLSTNNMVRLGLDKNGQSLTQGITIIGLHEDAAFNDFVFNSVYIGGENVGGSANTYAHYGIGSSTNRKLRNNILYNARSNGTGTGRHYATYHTTMVPNSSPNSDGNDFYVTGNGGILGYIYGQDVLTLPAWQALTGVDLNSICSDPMYVNPTGTAVTGDLHIGPTSPIQAAGQAFATVAGDYDNQSRSSLSPVDIGADAGNFQPMAVQLPEVVLTGNGILLADGDLTPSLADGTDLGGVACTGQGPQQFVLQNTGSAPLLISTYGFSGPGASQFSVVVPPPGVILPGQSATFSLAFTASMPGTAVAQFNMGCNDWDESAYNFAVQGNSLGDSVAPVAVCNPYTAFLGPSGTLSLAPAALAAASIDNCGIASYTAAPNSYTCAHLGTSNVLVHVADYYGLQDSCMATVVIADSTRPVALCQNLGATLDVTGQVTLFDVNFDNGSYDNCGVDSLWASQTQFFCSNLGQNTVTLHVRDHSGNVGTCTAQLSILDAATPTVSCQSTTLYLNAQGQAVLNPSAVEAASSDNCGVVSRGLSLSQFTCAHIGTQNVLLTVADATGNSVTCLAPVTVLDTLAPDLVCAGLTLIVPDSGSTTLTAAMVGSATDACGVAGYQLSQTSFSCADIGNASVQLSALDGSGNLDTCMVVVQVVAAPLTALVAVDSASGCGHAIACHGQLTGSASVTADGGCQPYTYAWSGGQTGVTVSGLGAGTHSVTVTAADGQQQVQTVTLSEPPALTVTLASSSPTCPADSNGTLAVTGAGGQSCQPYTFQWSNGATTPTVSGLGQGTYTVTMTDVAGCQAILSTTVGVVPQPPLAITETQGNLIATSGFAAYQWQDSSGAIAGATAGQYAPQASGTYTVVVTDSSGCTWTSQGYAFAFVAIANPLGPVNTIGIYPNPGTGVFQFSVASPVGEQVGVRVYDARGHTVYAGAYARLGGGEVLDLHGVAAGLYVVALHTEGGQSWRLRVVRE